MTNARRPMGGIAGCILLGNELLTAPIMNCILQRVYVGKAVVIQSHPG